MANVLRTSGAWKSVLKELDQVFFHPEKPSDINKFFKTIQKEHETVKIKSSQEVQNEIEFLKNTAVQLEKDFDKRIQQGRREIDLDIELIQLAIQLIEDQKGFVEKIINIPKVKKYKERLQRLLLKRKNFHLSLQKELENARGKLDKTQKDFDFLVEEKCRQIQLKVKLVEKVLKSHELAGALSELELINHLSSLPENHFIINDVNLSINKSVRFDGEWLKSAQIDHVVVTPAGIFIIETKNWSREFAQDGAYFNPYQQVKRASYLCYKLIGERYRLNPRSIIAYKGALPKKPAESFVKVLPIKEVKGYISWFKEKKIADRDIENISGWFASQ